MEVSVRIFKIIQHTRYFIVLFWLATVGFGIWLGPELFFRTSMDFSAPPHTPSHDAIMKLSVDFPVMANNSETILLLESKKSHDSVLSDALHTFGCKVEKWFNGYEDPDLPLQFLSYYWFVDRDMASGGLQFLSPDNTSTIMMLATNSSELQKVTVFVSRLLKFIDDSKSLLDDAGVTARLTGFGPMIHDAQLSAVQDFENVDIYFAPLAFLVLGIVINSFRLLMIALLCIAVSVALSLAILCAMTMPFINVSIAIIGPAIMMSCIIAFSIDYNLFLLTRFRAEINQQKETYTAVQVMLATAGKNVFVSSLTIITCFLGLIFFQMPIISSLGISAAVGIGSCLLTNLTLTPALLLIFPNFFRKSSSEQIRDTLHSIRNSIASFQGREELVNDGDEEKGFVENGENDDVVQTDGKNGDDLLHEEIHHSEKEENPNTHLLIDEGVVHEYGSINAGVNSEEKDTSKKKKGTWWKKIGLLSIKYYWVIILLAIAISVPFIYQIFPYETTLDISMLIPKDTDAAQALKSMKTEFPAGLLAPFFLLVDTRNTTGGVAGDDFFLDGQTIIGKLSKDVKDLDETMCESIMESQGKPVTYQFVYHMFLDPSFSNATYHSEYGRLYRFLWEHTVNSQNTSTVITINTEIDPYGPDVRVFLHEIRASLDEMRKIDRLKQYNYYLAGATAEVVDIQDTTYSIFPTMILITMGVVYVIVGLLFRSVFLPLRLLLTMILTLGWVYGIAVLVFQKGILNWLAPSWKDYERQELWFFVPIMAFSIIVGLGLDYDLFLITRISEYCEKGCSNRQAIIKGLSKTGWIITIAGIIMALAFGGLMVSRMLVLQQFSFYLVISTLLDTFIVRTVIVPAMTHLFGKANWWPRKFPETQYCDSSDSE